MKTVLIALLLIVGVGVIPGITYANVLPLGVAVPEPSLELLLGISLIGLVAVGIVRRKMKKKAVAKAR